MLTGQECRKADEYASLRLGRPSDASIKKAAYWMCMRKGLNPDGKIKGSETTMLEDATQTLMNHWTKVEAMELARSYFEAES